MIDRMTPRTMIVLTALAIVVVGLVGWFAFVSPERSEASAVQVEIDQMQARLDVAEKISQDPNKAERQVQLRHLETAMPQETRVAMPQVLRQLSEAARKANVRIRGVTPGAAVPLSGYQAVPISLVVDGHYFGIANFLELLRRQAVNTEDGVEASGRLYSVDSVILGAGSSSTPGASELGATLNLNAFSYLGGSSTATPTTTPTETPDTDGAAAGTDD